jgi:5-methyltetrahydropteroyltriglutamate--homocysteine methyltransferase
VGSFIRPRPLVEAHIAHAQGRMGAEELRTLEDAAILDVLRLQQDVGIDVFSDGEFRRRGFTTDFADAVDGFVSGRALFRPTSQLPAGGAPPISSPVELSGGVIGRKLRLRHRLTANQVSFLKQHAPGPFKMTLPAASHVFARGYHPDTTDAVYGTRAAALHDVASVIRAEIEALIADEVPYIQLDNPHYTDFVSDDLKHEYRLAGLDPTQILQEGIEADNYSLSGLDRTQTLIAMHLCRGNVGLGPDTPALWHKAGGYEPIAEAAFSQLDVDAFLLEYDTERAGGFEPLRFVPRGKTVVLGLVTTKSGELEKQETLLARIDEAAKYVPLEDLALSPQCGFASMLQGNPVTETDERRKLELVVDTARKVWG